MNTPLRTALLILLTQSPAWADAETLGRLFHTPEQRAALDRQRLLNPGNAGATDNEASQTLNGEVRRSSGRDTRWINGEASTNASAPRIPVGDTLHPGSGERERLLGDGKIIVKPARQDR